MNYLESFLNNYNCINTRNAYESHITQFLEYVNKDINDISYGDLTNYKEHFSQQYSTGSMALKIRAIKKYFDYLYYDKEVIDTNSTISKNGKRFKEDKVVTKQKTYIPMQEAKRLIQFGKNSRDKAIIAVYLTIGLRASELINLTLHDYEQGIAVVKTKGSKPREILFNKSCCKYIDAYLETRKDCEYDNLFISNQGTPMRTEVITRTLKCIASHANLPMDITNHSLRHTVVSDVVKTYDIETARAFINHASCTTTMRYTHSTNEEVRNVAINMSL